MIKGLSASFIFGFLLLSGGSARAGVFDDIIDSITPGFIQDAVHPTCGMPGNSHVVVRNNLSFPIEVKLDREKYGEHSATLAPSQEFRAPICNRLQFNVNVYTTQNCGLKLIAKSRYTRPYGDEIATISESGIAFKQGDALDTAGRVAGVGLTAVGIYFGVPPQALATVGVNEAAVAASCQQNSLLCLNGVAKYAKGMVRSSITSRGCALPSEVSQQVAEASSTAPAPVASTPNGTTTQIDTEKAARIEAEREKVRLEAEREQALIKERQQQRELKAREREQIRASNRQAQNELNASLINAGSNIVAAIIGSLNKPRDSSGSTSGNNQQPGASTPAAVSMQQPAQYPQGGYPMSGGYMQQPAQYPQGGYPMSGGYMQQPAQYPQGGYPMSGGYMQQPAQYPQGGYPMSGGYMQQPAQYPQGGYPMSGGYMQQAQPFSQSANMTAGAIQAVNPSTSAVDIFQSLGLVPDPTCSLQGLIIKMINGQTLCAHQRAPYAPGRYVYNGKVLIPAK